MLRITRLDKTTLELDHHPSDCSPAYYVFGYNEQNSFASCSRGARPKVVLKHYLLRGGRYASCVHAGGLSCLKTLHWVLFTMSSLTRTTWLLRAGSFASTAMLKVQLIQEFSSYICAHYFVVFFLYIDVNEKYSFLRKIFYVQYFARCNSTRYKRVSVYYFERFLIT